MPKALDEDQVRNLRIAAQHFAPARQPNGARRPKGERRLAWPLGYVRTLGGVDAYLAGRARLPDLARADLEALVAEAQLCVVPAVRGCIYLVPASDAALCLRIAEAQSAPRDARDAERAGIRPGELQDVAAAVLATLRADGAETTDGLRRRLPAGSFRSLGDRGKKAGVSSTLPPALRQLEFAGSIHRMPVEGRLDHEKYVWRAATVDPFAAADLPSDLPRLHALLLARFLDFAGVTDLAAFCAWSGLTQRDAKAALPHTEFTPIEAAGLGAGAMASPHLDALRPQAEGAAAPVAFLPFEDNLVHLVGGLTPFVDASLHGMLVPTWVQGMTMRPLAEAKHVMLRTIVADGRIRGFWEYDPDTNEVVTHLFDPPGKAVRTAIDATADDTAKFLHEQFGHGRSFSLDDDQDLRRRTAHLKKMAARQA